MPAMMPEVQISNIHVDTSKYDDKDLVWTKEERIDKYTPPTKKTIQDVHNEINEQIKNKDEEIKRLKLSVRGRNAVKKRRMQYKCEKHPSSTKYSISKR